MLCFNPLCSHKVSHWLLIFIMQATEIKLYLVQSSLLPKNSSNSKSENVYYDITPSNVHYSLASQNLTLLELHDYCI